MSKLPFMPMFVGDYIADTPELSIEAHGAYCLILFYTWKGRKFLEDDDKKMCRILRLGNRKWQKIKKEILPYFDLSDGTWFQQKLSEMLAETKQKSDKNKANGRLGGIAKSLKNKETTLANATNKSSILEPESKPDIIEHDWSELRGWLKEDLQEPFSVVIKLTRDFTVDVIQDAFDRIKKEKTPPLGKRVVYLRKRCSDRKAMGHSASPSNKGDFTKLKVETRLREISKTAGRGRATAVEEGYIRGEQWAKDIIWPNEANV